MARPKPTSRKLNATGKRSIEKGGKVNGKQSKT